MFYYMSFIYFLDKNQTRLGEDLKLIKSELTIKQLKQSAPQRANIEDWEEYLTNNIDNHAILQYWLLRLQIFIEEIKDVSYPLINSTENLVEAFELDVGNVDGLCVRDNLTLYYPDYYLKFKINTCMEGTYSDGFTIDVRWKLDEGPKDKINEFLKIFDGDERERLTKENKLWELLEDESCLIKSMIKKELSLNEK